MRLRTTLLVAATALVGLLSVGPASSSAAAPLPLGKLALGRASPSDALPGFSARRFSVRCPGVAEPEHGIFAMAPAAGKRRGFLLFFSGGAGTSYWSGGGSGLDFFQSLRRAGFIVVQVRWVDGWLKSARGDATGPARLACGPATVVKWAYERVFKPLRLKPAKVGRCGFCVTGNSGGASQVSYALSHYGLDTILDAGVPTGGPPHADLVKGCLGTDPAYALPARRIDSSYGFTRDGPCARRDESFRDRWARDGIATGGRDYVHPRTHIVFLLGEEDRTSAVPQALEYAARLRRARSPRVSVARVAGMPHALSRSKAGLAALGRVLRGS